MTINPNSPDVRLILGNLYGIDPNQIRIEGTQFYNSYRIILPDGKERIVYITDLGGKYEIRDVLSGRTAYYQPSDGRVTISQTVSSGGGESGKPYTSTTITTEYRINREEQKITPQDLKEIVQNYLRQQLNDSNLTISNLYVKYSNKDNIYEIHVRTSDGREFVVYTDKYPYDLPKSYRISLELEETSATYYYPREVAEKIGKDRVTVESKDFDLTVDLLQQRVRAGYEEYLRRLEEELVKDALNKLRQENPDAYEFISKNLRNYTIEEFNTLAEKWNKEVLPELEKQSVQNYLNRLIQENPDAYNYISSRLRNYTIDELNKLIEEYNEKLKNRPLLDLKDAAILPYDEKKMLELYKQQRLQKWEEMWKDKDLSNPGYRFQYELGKALISSDWFNWLDAKIASFFGKSMDALKDVTGYKTIEDWRNEITALYKIGKISEKEYNWWMKEFDKMERDAIMRGALLFTIPVAFVAPELALALVASELAGTTAYKKTIDATGNKGLAILVDLATQLGVGYGVFKSLEKISEWARTSALKKYGDIKINRLSITTLDQETGRYAFIGDAELKLGDGSYVQAKILGSGNRLEIVPADDPTKAITVMINPEALRNLKTLTQKVMSGQASPEEIAEFFESYFKIQRGLSKIKDASYFDVQTGITNYKISYLDELGEGFELRILTKPELLKAYKTEDLRAIPELKDLYIFKIDNPDDLPKIANEQIAIIRTEKGEVLNLIKFGHSDVEGFVYYFDPIKGRVIKIPVQLEEIATKFKQDISVKVLGPNVYSIRVGDLVGYTIRLGKLKDGTKVWQLEMIDPKTGKTLGSKTIPVERTDELLEFITKQPTILERYRIKPKKGEKSMEEIIDELKEISVAAEPTIKLPLTVREPLKIEVKGDKAYVYTDSLGLIAEVPRSIADEISRKGKVDPYDINNLAKHLKDNLGIDMTFLNRLDITFDKIIIEEGNNRVVAPVTSTSKAKVTVKIQPTEQPTEMLNKQLSKVDQLEMQKQRQNQKTIQRQKTVQELEELFKFDFSLPRIPRIPRIRPPEPIKFDKKSRPSVRPKKEEDEGTGARGRLKTRFFL